MFELSSSHVDAFRDCNDVGNVIHCLLSAFEEMLCSKISSSRHLLLSYEVMYPQCTAYYKLATIFKPLLMRKSKKFKRSCLLGFAKFITVQTVEKDSISYCKHFKKTTVLFMFLVS